MDREIPKEVKKKERLRSAIRYALIVAVVVGVGWWLVSIFGTSAAKERLTIAKIERGSITTTINAMGRVVPYSEEIVVAPISSRILEVYKNTGDVVEAGEPLLKLELSGVESDYQKSLDQLAVKRSRLEQSRTMQRSNISELQMQQEVKKLQLEKMRTELQNEKYLDSIGASTAERVQEIGLQYSVLGLEYKQLKERILYEREKAEAEIRVQELEYGIFERELLESARLLEDARILSPQRATLTYINNQIGVQVSPGMQLVIVSDLTRYKVIAEVADGLANKLSLGAKAVVKVGGGELAGTVVNITPSVENGVVGFVVVFDDDHSKLLRGGVSVDLYVEYGVKADVLRIPNGPYYRGAAEYELWSVEGQRAVKRKVVLGESSYDYVEVKSGAEEGEEFVLSDMSNFRAKQSVKLK